MKEAITEAGQVSPAWLTSVLRARGYLARGAVRSIELDTSPTIVSTILRLNVRYSDDSSIAPPARLFLKISKPGTAPELPHKEASFYNELAAKMPGGPFIRCYDAVFSEETGRGHVLLEDLSETHSRPPWPLPPSIEQCERAVDCLAQLHAFWWEHPRLGAGIGELEDPATLQSGISEHQERTERFIAFLGDRLSGERKAIYTRVLASLPDLWEHSTRRQDLTLIHGDAHFWNFLFPARPEGEVRIFDWHNWGVGRGTDDLAYMIALHWYPERRAALEGRLLSRYLGCLAERGVSGYGMDQCWTDYRRSAIDNLLLPVTQWSNGMAPLVWWPHLERAMLAFRDLVCAALLAP